MWRQRWIGLAFAVSLLAVWAAACGGDGESRATATPTSTPTVTPTPTPIGFLPTPTPESTPRRPGTMATPAPTVVVPGGLVFEHPEGRLRWDGPDDRVVSERWGHCSYADPAWGVPGLIIVGEALSFWGARAVRREPDWYWTGYSHGEWQIWQGDDASTVYLVHTRERGIAFEYRSFLCR